jgi:hypothetical protein
MGQAGPDSRRARHHGFGYAHFDTSAHEQAMPRTHDGGADEVSSDLVRVMRAATARFLQRRGSEAEDYHLLFGCVSGGDFGAMGMHFVNMSLVGDGEIDATHPEIVIYEPQPNGRLRLIGADYLVFADAWDATHSSAPELMGQLFHRFDAPNRFGLPAFYTLHVWAWRTARPAPSSTGTRTCRATRFPANSTERHFSRTTYAVRPGQPGLTARAAAWRLKASSVDRTEGCDADTSERRAGRDGAGRRVLGPADPPQSRLVTAR